jgi:HK97 family phage major capsid protein
MLDRLNRQMTEAQDRYRSLESLIAEEDRDPTDVEEGEMKALRSRMTELQPRILETVELERRLNDSASALASVPAATVPASASVRPSHGRQAPPSGLDAYRSFGALAQARAAGEVDPDAYRVMIDSANDYLIEHARAFVDVTTVDVPGLVPPIWLRTIADTITASQPFVAAFSQLPLPDVGMTLTYPSITTRPLVGKQTPTEKSEIPSRKTTITSGTTDVDTYGGGEDVSVQVLQRTDPSYLSLMLDLYAEAMAIATDTDAINVALGAFGASVGIGTDPTQWNRVIAGVVADLLTASRLMPDTFVVGTGLWEGMAGATDTDGRPLFPNAAPMNPLGQTSFDSTTGNMRGMTFVVDPLMPPDTGIIGNRAAFTSLLGPVQTLSADNVSKLGRDYAVFRFAAFLTRRPDAAAVVSTSVAVVP